MSYYYNSHVIRSNDKRAIEKLELKIEELTAKQERMKAINAYYRKKKNIYGFPDLSDEERKDICWNLSYGKNPKPYPSFTLSNNGAEIRRLKGRLEHLKEIKARGTQEHSEEETGVKGLKVIENAEEVRLLLIFDEELDEKTIKLLDGNRFEWSPKFKAWERVLNNSSKYAAECVIEQLKEWAENEQQNK